MPLKGVVSTVVISTVVLEGWSTKLDPDIRIMESLKVRALCTLCKLGAGIITLCSWAAPGTRSCPAEGGRLWAGRVCVFRRLGRAFYPGACLP